MFFKGVPNLTDLAFQSGTAYDFFISLFVLHHPERFGLRASWAAGVRSRLPAVQRQFLEHAMDIIAVPLTWLCQPQNANQDSASMLSALAALPAADRLETLLIGREVSAEARLTGSRIQSEHHYHPEDVEALRGFFQHRANPVKAKTLQNFAEALVDSAQFGEGLLSAYQTYFEVFFQEEERRILPFLQQGLTDSQHKAADLPLKDLINSLSHGISYESFDTIRRLILIPSYWSSPLVFLHNPQPDEMILVFGCRSDSQNLIPGQYVPDALISALKALSDPTRLRIACYLRESPHSPSSLARLLRLRPPTVIHHLNTLRLAGLVQILIASNGERRYAVREEAIATTLQQLDVYLTTPPAKK